MASVTFTNLVTGDEVTTVPILPKEWCEHTKSICSQCVGEWQADLGVGVTTWWLAHHDPEEEIKKFLLGKEGTNASS